MKAILNIMLTPFKIIWSIFDNDAHRIVSKKGLNLLQMEEDDLTDDEWLIREKHFDTIAFGEWLLSHDISFVDNTDKGNIYDYNGIQLTMEELHEIYSKQK